MNYEQLNQLFNERQACRKYSAQEVEKEKLDKIIESSLLSPSACNSQPWKLYCTAEREKAEKITSALTDLGRNEFLKDVSCYIAISEKTPSALKVGTESKFTNDRFVKYDIGEITAYITLVAKSLGLDTCVIGWVNEEKLSKVLGLGEGEKCEIVVAIGYSQDKLRKKSRKPISETVKML